MTTTVVANNQNNFSPASNLNSIITSDKTITTTVIEDRQTEFNKKAGLQQETLGGPNTYTTSYLTSTYAADNKFSPGAYSNNTISPLRNESANVIKEETKVSTFGGK